MSRLGGEAGAPDSTRAVIVCRYASQPCLYSSKDLPLVRIRHDDERPALLIAAAGGLLGQVKALLDQASVDWAHEIEPSPDRASGREQFVRAEVEFGIEVAGCRHVQLEKSIVLSPPSLLLGSGSSAAGMGSARRGEQCQYRRDRTVPALLGLW